MKRDSMIIVAAGINHRTARVEEREALAFAPAEMPPALGRLGGELGAAVLLSTCNRTELYATALDSPSLDRRLVELLNALKGVEVDLSRFYVRRHDDAVRHLYSVAAGIDSMVLGEAQILRQVREALSAATEAGSLNGVLNRLFHSALAVGKRARSETHIGRYGVSVSSTAVALARKTFGDLTERTVLVISAGSSGKLAARALAESGASRILVTNRTFARAAELARGLGGEAVPFEALPKALGASDIVISASGADSFVLGAQTVAPAVARRTGRGLLLIDIAVPRDIDPAVRDIPGVLLYDIDDLQAVSQASLRGRQKEVARVEAIIEEEVARFREWWHSLDVVPIIAGLRHRAESIRQQELEKALRRLPDLSDEARERIDAMTSAIVKKMLHQPIARLKDGADLASYVEALEDLFGLRQASAGK